MTYSDELLLSNIYQTIKILVIENEILLPKIKNKQLQTIVSNHLTNCDTMMQECHTLASAHKISLPKPDFFKRCEQIIIENYPCVDANNISSLIPSIVINHIHTIKDVYDLESATSETISLAKRLLALQEKYLSALHEICTSSASKV